ncbi:probable E3 ubiquitin-protein ligase ARI2 [Salvia splendens]|uniref:probable E3 ubiquitin-protein ligase ARI2 n=1 Tax=Salvia splendens TaxID=180675 RepID=UPI001C27E3C4|nr:probable E3 ubiquitin-protein ligase ARI2 [Salvia splendens]
MSDDGSEENDCSYSSDQDAEPLDGFENDDSDDQWVAHKAPSSKVITKASLLAAQREDLQTVMDLLSVREHHARTLLIHYRWDVEKLTAVYVEKGRSHMFSEAGVSMTEIVDLDPDEPSSTVMCSICIDDVPVEDITKMDCGHSFCNSCWTGHFRVKINEMVNQKQKRLMYGPYKCKRYLLELDGIRVQVRSVYIEGRSQPSKDLYFLAYRIRITNNLDHAVQLLRRHWIITDANGKTECPWSG